MVALCKKWLTELIYMIMYVGVHLTDYSEGRHVFTLVFCIGIHVNIRY